MSSILHALLLGLLQGFTEFLPVSSSAHLILLPKFMQWEDFGLPFDITIHLGSLLAIIIYFMYNKQFKQNLQAISMTRLFKLLVIGTIPVGLSGLLFKDYIEHYSRSIELISITTMVFGILLGVSYYVYLNKDKVNKFKCLNFKDFSIKFALLIGLSQAIAIIPGVSRSGVTLTAGLLLGFNLLAASRFSFLLAIPVILSAGFKQSLDLIYTPE
ncbi:MAG: undecaprenyl-diphosphate phosphatase, partial [Gammaproteobacteria bacterium]